jgi:hypothetical protein
MHPWLAASEKKPAGAKAPVVVAMVMYGLKPASF